MSDFAGHLAPRPTDPLLSVMEAARSDLRDHKVDLSLGVYRDRNGNTPVLAAVKAAEAQLVETQMTKTYEGMRGNIAFCEGIARLVFGEAGAQELPHISFATPGGCGALSHSVQLLRRMNDQASVWVSDPTWPNHKAIVRASQCALREYPYVDQRGGKLVFDDLISCLSTASPGDGIFLQGVGHNTTGVDFTNAQWQELGALCERQSLIPIVDIAYHGLGIDLDTDLIGVRGFLNSVSLAMIAYSCSKNFALYRERAGCFLLRAPSRQIADIAGQHVSEIARRTYSMPPAHGAAIVATILGDSDLNAQWRAELSAMTEHINSARQVFSEHLTRYCEDDRYAAIASHSGMFSLLPITQSGVTALARDDAIYLPASGRINIAGLDMKRIEHIAKSISKHI